MSRGEFVDRDRVEETFLARTAYMRETGTPIWVGEFGPVYTGDPERDEQRYRLLEDQLEIFARHDASWSLWTYKDIGLQGVVTPIPSRPTCAGSRRCWRRRPGWAWTPGAPPTPGVRDLIEPIEQLFEDEFPEFAPYPWGARTWIAGHIRHVMLAEAMVDDFARAFEGVSPDEAEALADAFAFSNCVIRERLAGILRQTTSPRVPR